MAVGVMDTTPQAAKQPDDLRSVATEGSPRGICSPPGFRKALTCVKLTRPFVSQPSARSLGWSRSWCPRPECVDVVGPERACTTTDVDGLEPTLPDRGDELLGGYDIPRPDPSRSARTTCGLAGAQRVARPAQERSLGPFEMLVSPHQDGRYNAPVTPATTTDPHRSSRFRLRNPAPPSRRLQVALGARGEAPLTYSACALHDVPNTTSVPTNVPHVT